MENNPPAVAVANNAANHLPRHLVVPAANPPPAAATSAMGECSAMIDKDIELGRLNANTSLAQGPQHYFQEVCEVGVLLNNTAKMVLKLKEANQEFNSVTELAAMREVKARMEKDMDEVGKMAHDIKEKLKKMITNHIEKIKNPGCERGSAIDILWMSLTIALKAKLEERKSDLQDLGKTIWQAYLQVLQKRTSTATGIKLSDEVISVIDIGSVVKMFENAQQGISAEQMVAAVDEIKERHAAATDFGKKILEVQQIFQRMAAVLGMVEKIDKALDNIDKVLPQVQRDDDDLPFLVVVIGLGLFLPALDLSDFLGLSMHVVAWKHERLFPDRPSMYHCRFSWAAFSHVIIS